MAIVSTSGYWWVYSLLDDPWSFLLLENILFAYFCHCASDSHHNLFSALIDVFLSLCFSKAA